MRALCAVVVLAASPVCAGDLFPPEQMARIRDGLRDIYNLDHQRAAATFEHLIADSPEDPAGYVYLATTLWRQELSEKQELSIDRFAASDFFAEKSHPLGSVDPALEARFRHLSDQAIASAKRRLSRTPGDRASLFLLGQTYQNLASFEASLKRNWWAAFRFGSRAYDYHRELLRRDPQFYDARLATGVCTYVVGSLGWSARWLALLMGYRGSAERGKTEIESAARQGQLAADDARVILVVIHTREHDYQRAYGYLAELHRSYPRNYLFELDMAGLALRMKRPDQAIGAYREILRKHDAREHNYQKLERASLYNRVGVAFRAKNDLAESLDWFRRALEQPAASANAITLAHLELGKTLDRMGRRTDAIAQFRVVAASPDVAGSRQEAERLLQSPGRYH